MPKIIMMLLAVILSACGMQNEKPKPPIKLSSEKLSFLVNKTNTYLTLSKQHQDQQGFVLSDECDALLFTSLYATVSGTSVNIKAAQSEPGKWYRKSIVNGKDPCYPDHSQSSISRDMLLGLMTYIWKTKNLSMAEDLWGYGSNNDWIMGEGVLSRTYFTPQMQSLLAELIYRLGGPDMPVYRNIPQHRTVNTGFQAHLDVLSILLEADMKGSIESSDLAILKQYNDRNQQNALFSYAYHKYTDGNYNIAVDTLLHDVWFPKDRLPTNHDRKEPYLWQRDMGLDWHPAQENAKVFPGVDFLFVANLIIQEVK